MSQTPIYKQHTGWLRHRLGKTDTQGLSSSSRTDDELWILLEHYSEIEEVGLQFIQKKGFNKLKSKKIYKEFQAFIRQSKNYYYSAQTLHPRSAGLLYYYCFLNLAKAALVLNDPNIAGRKIGHGASCMPRDFSKLKEETVKITGEGGVFTKLYEWYFGLSIKTPQSLNIKKLLNYCTDISSQCEMAGIGECKMLPCYYVMQVNQNSIPPTGWPLIGISSFNLCTRYKKSFSKFFENFNRVKLPEVNGIEYFKIDYLTLNSYTFFQSKSSFNWTNAKMPPVFESKNLTITSLATLRASNYFVQDIDFYISLPYSTNNQIPMDETIAIYLIMFYVSNLVRYNPRHLEELLSKKEAWIIDSFVRSCPLTFLRSFISKIVNTDYYINTR